MIFSKNRWAIRSAPIASIGAKQSCRLGPISVVAGLSAAGVSARHQGASHDESPRPSNSMTGLNWERATVTGWLLTVEIELRTNHEHNI
jgi:hypothetical protein